MKGNDSLKIYISIWFIFKFGINEQFNLMTSKLKKTYVNVVKNYTLMKINFESFEKFTLRR